MRIEDLTPLQIEEIEVNYDKYIKLRQQARNIMVELQLHFDLTYTQIWNYCEIKRKETRRQHADQESKIRPTAGSNQDIA